MRERENGERVRVKDGQSDQVIPLKRIELERKKRERKKNEREREREREERERGRKMRERESQSTGIKKLYQIFLSFDQISSIEERYNSFSLSFFLLSLPLFSLSLLSLSLLPLTILSTSHHNEKMYLLNTQTILTQRTRE